MPDEDKKAVAEELDKKRKDVQSRREATAVKRENAQLAREKIFAQRAALAKIEDGPEQEAEFWQMQDAIQEIQHEILKLQALNHEEQDEVNVLRRLADGYANELQGLLEDKQTKHENMQTLQENLQRLREDAQRRQEEDKAKARMKREKDD